MNRGRNPLGIVQPVDAEDQSAPRLARSRDAYADWPACLVPHVAFVACRSDTPRSSPVRSIQPPAISARPLPAEIIGEIAAIIFRLEADQIELAQRARISSCCGSV